MQKSEVGDSLSSNSIKLKNQLIAEELSKGHALEKHIVEKGEFPGWIRTRDQLKTHIENTLNDSKTLFGISKKTQKPIYYNKETNTIIIRQIKSKDGGTVFQPDDQIDYFLRELKR